MKRILNITVLMVIAILITMSVYSQTQDEIIAEAVCGQRIAQYDVKLNSPFVKERRGESETVNPETGNVSYTLSLFNLNARTFDETLSLTYNSASAKLKQESYCNTGVALHNINENFTDKEIAKANFAVGWKFNIPFVESMYNTTFVHMPDGTVYLEDASSDTGLSGYMLKNVTFKKSDSGYLLNYLDGTVYKFDTDGFLTEKSDRNDNYVQYNWNKSLTPYVLEKITSCTGQSISFKYLDSAVEITLNGRKVTLGVEKQSDADKIPFLTYFIDAVNRKTSFEYSQKTIDYALVLDSEKMDINYYPLTSIIYNTGLKTIYKYDTAKKFSGNGYMSYLKLSERYDISNLEMVNRQQYFYNGEPDGYPKYSSGYIPSDYKYSAVIINQDSKRELISYNSVHDISEREISVGNKPQSRLLYKYDKRNRMPVQIVSEMFGNSGNDRAVYSEFVYNDRGELLSYDTYDNISDKGKQKKEYLYSNFYGINTYLKYKTDKATTVEVKSDTDSNGKNIEKTQIFVNGNLVKTIRYKYDDFGNNVYIKKQTDNDTYKTEKFVFTDKTGYAYPEQHIICGVEDTDGDTFDVYEEFEYDFFGNIISYTDACEGKTIYEYNNLGNPVKQILPNGGIRTVLYDYNKNTLKTSDALGNTLLYTYDPLGRLVFVKDGKGNILTQKEYAPTGLLECETDAVGTSFHYTYDGFNRVSGISAKDMTGKILSFTSYSYDEAYIFDGKTYSRFETSLKGETGEYKTAYLFDFLGRQRLCENGNGENKRITTYEYDYAGNNIRTVLPDGSITDCTYNAFGNMLSSTRDGVSEYYTYDLLGNMKSHTDGEGNTVTSSYNSLGLNLKNTFPYNGGNSFSVTKNYYDPCGRVTKRTDAEGNSEKYFYDNSGNLVSCLYGDGITTYEYDAENRIISMSTGKAGNLHTQHYEYDSFGNLVKSTDEMGFSQSYTYDLNGNVLSCIDKNGNIVYNTYDGLNRIIRTSNSLDNTCFDYTYDSAGKLVRVNNTEYKYNTFGELISQKEGNIEQKYSYNSLGLRTEYSVENCGVVQMNQNYTYDAFGRLSAVTSPLGRQSYTYDRAGRLVSTYGDTSKIGTQYSYFPSGNIESQIQIVGGKITDEVRYEYDRNGSRTLEKSFDGEKRYTYDSRNRLHEVIDGGILSVYSYDDFGNISAVNYFSENVSSSTKYVYDANNRLTESFEDNLRTEYTYDKQGNLICRKNDIGRTDYFYNGFNKMTGVSGENLTAEYTYDYSGLRTSKTVNGVFTQLVNDGQNVSAQYVDGRVNCFYRGISLIGYTDSDSNANFYQFNAHGDVISVLDCFGNTVHSYDYNEFGKQKESAENLFLPQYGMKADTNPFRYCGEYFDEETGFVYLRARYYSPDIGRFVSEDPIKDGNNWYVYCGNNPILFIDTTGLQREAGYYTIDGVYGWYDDPDAAEFGKDSIAYKIIDRAGRNWFAIDSPDERKKQHAIAEHARELARGRYEMVYLTDADIDAGVTIHTIGKKQYKDVSVPIDNALAEIKLEAESKWVVDFPWFISKVDNHKPWDIKRETPWNETIKSTYPGRHDAQVIYHGSIVTLEYLGNYTYGYIGRAMGLSNDVLHMGSYVVAKFPIKGEALENEFNDWKAIDKGVAAYDKNN